MINETPAHIPKEILVGYQYRSNTFNGKLAFATAESFTGKIYSETNFFRWCDSAIDKDTFKNELMNGFLLNKSRSRYSAYGTDTLRVFHPLGFEFEIDISNISYILQHSNVNMSEITSKCILGWINGKLVLIPENSPLYERSNSMNNQEFKKVGTKITIGKQYITKNAEKCIYLGEQDYYFNSSKNLTRKERELIHKNFEQEFQTISDNKNSNHFPYWFILKNSVKQHLCYNIEKNSFFNVLKSELKLENTAEPILPEEVESLLDDFVKTDNGSPTISVIENHADHIFKWIKIAHAEYFSGYYDTNRNILLGLLNDNKTGIFINYNFDEHVNTATRTDASYKNKTAQENNSEIILRKASTVPYISSFYRSHLNYILWFKMCEKGYVKPRGVENFDFSAIKDVLKFFNVFSIGKYQKTDNIEIFDFYSNYREHKEIEIFDLEALNSFLDECVEALNGKVDNINDLRKESNVPIIMDLYNKFFEQEKEKMLIRIDQHLKVISLYKEKNDSYNIFNGKE